MADWQWNELSGNTAGKASCPAPPLVPGRDVAFCDGPVQADRCAREAPRGDARADPTRGLLAGARRASSDSPVLPLASSGNEVLARLRTAHQVPSVPKPHAARERKQPRAAFARAGAENICARTAPGLNHKLISCSKCWMAARWHPSHASLPAHQLMAARVGGSSLAASHGPCCRRHRRRGHASVGAARAGRLAR
jgi:hypothetical protein